MNRNSDISGSRHWGEIRSVTDSSQCSRAQAGEGVVLLIGVSGGPGSLDNPALTPRWNQSIRTIPGPRLR